MLVEIDDGEFVFRFADSKEHLRYAVEILVHTIDSDGVVRLGLHAIVTPSLLAKVSRKPVAVGAEVDSPTFAKTIEYK
jgi:hypothetical protein